MSTLPNRVVKRNGDLNDTIGFILAVIRDKSHQLRKLAEPLYNADPLQAAANIHAWLLTFISYKKDPDGMELIRTPEASLQDRRNGIDCEDYTILTACLLKEMGHAGRAFLTIVDLDPVPGFEHIYLSILPEGTATHSTINGTQPQGIGVDMLLAFGQHPSFIQKAMQINILGGTGTRCHQPHPSILAGMNPADQRKAFWLNAADEAARPFIATILPYVRDVARDGNIIWEANAPIADIERMLSAALDAGELHNRDGLGAVHSGNKRRKDFQDSEKKPSGAVNIRRGIARVSPILIAGRGAFLLLVRLNAFHLASKMRLMYLDQDKAKKAKLNMAAWAKAKAALPKLEKTWLDLGGHLDKLKEAISKGSGVPATKLLGEIATATATVSAVPIIVAIAPVLAVIPWKDLVGEKGEKLEDEDIVAKVKAFVASKTGGGGGSSGSSSNQVEKEIENALQEGSGNNTNRTPEPEAGKSKTGLYIGIGVGVLAIAGTVAFVATRDKDNK